MRISLSVATLFCLLIRSTLAANPEALFSKEHGADFEPVKGKVRYLREGCSLYADKDLTMKRCPKELDSLRYVLAPYDGGKARCTRAGTAFAVALLDQINTDHKAAVLAYLADTGWQPVSDMPKFILFHTNGADREGGVFWKDVQKGDVVDMTSGAVLSFNPGKDRGLKSTLKPPITKP